MSFSAAGDRARIVLGRVAGAHGIRGWVRVQSWAEVPENVLEYSRWYLGEDATPVQVVAGKSQGKLLLAKLSGVDDRDTAAELTGATLRIDRSELPALASGEYYWCDLLGLEIVNRDGTSLGRVQEMMVTGANDVMVVAGSRQRLLPFVPGLYVDAVDLDAGLIRVDWDPDD